jgi:hypothetical protein
MRRKVARLTFFLDTLPCMALSSAIQLLKPMSTVLLPQSICERHRNS